MTNPQENAKELYLWLRTCPLDFLVLDMEGAAKRGTVKVVFDLILPNTEANIASLILGVEETTNES